MQDTNSYPSSLARLAQIEISFLMLGARFLGFPRKLKVVNCYLLSPTTKESFMSGLGKVKKYIKANCPKSIWTLYFELGDELASRSVFSKIYSHNWWESHESVSGPGSDLAQTSAIREEIPILVKELNARSFLDAPCGDFNWMKEVKLDLDTYIGADIVPELIAQNQQRYGNEVRKFICLDITKDNLPEVDIILCRDCFIHLSFKRITAAMKNFKKSKSKYLVTTTYPGLKEEYRDIITGNMRLIDLELPPFNFPKPLKLINEKTTHIGEPKERSLGVWKLEDMNL
jgi:hypothetical protein